MRAMLTLLLCFLLLVWSNRQSLAAIREHEHPVPEKLGSVRFPTWCSSAMSALDGSDFKVGYAASAMAARYAIERRQWSDAAQLNPVDGASPQVLAVTLWARSVGLARNGKPTSARQEIEKLKSACEKLRATGDDYWATQVHVQMNEALAWVAQVEGKSDEALKLMRAAADEEDAIEKRPVTPGAIVPAREQLGDLLLEANQPQEALGEFERALTITPQRRGALTGKDRAYQMLAAAKPGQRTARFIFYGRSLTGYSGPPENRRGAFHGLPEGVVAVAD